MKKDEQQERYIFVGQIALRNPDGSCQQAEPLYRKIVGGEDTEAKLYDEIGKALAHHFKLDLNQI